jgi:beta-lactamase superfamily II metal-dependent hydrolase
LSLRKQKRTKSNRCLRMSDQFDPPSAEEIEVSLFGPGYGEAIVVHLGDQQWLVVDSCLEPVSGIPAALHYLHGLNVEVATAVKLVVATHWHDDHIRGISAILRECASARFVLSSALSTREFLRLVSLYRGPITVQTSSGLEEFGDVFDVLRDRQNSKATMPPAVRAIADRRLYDAVLNIKPRPLAASVHALSPSDATVTLAEVAFADLWPQEGAPRKALPSPTSNQASVALWCQVEHHGFLLGADLERSSRTDTGWSAILDESTVARGKAAAYKVAHHGAASGHDDRVWTNLLVSQPHAVLTPYSRGNNTLPTPSDADRIINLTPHAYITAPPRQRRENWTRVIVRQKVNTTTKRMHGVDIGWGHVRLRCPITAAIGSWEVETFGDARPLAETFRRS